MPTYEPKIRVGASAVLKDGRSGEIVQVEPERPVESAHDEDLTIHVRLDDGETAVVTPADIHELTPPTGDETAAGG